jgi:acyl-CoA hydrolase
MKASVNYVGNSSMIGIRVESENIQTGKKSTVIRPILQWYPKIQKGNNASTRLNSFN